MKESYENFESLLRVKGINKKEFSKYSKIPYNTVVGWKKSGYVPSYAMVLLKNLPSSKNLTVKKLIDAGLPKAIFWNNNLNKEIPKDILIVSTLKRSYNDFTIRNLIEFFGEDSVLASLIKHRDRVSENLIKEVLAYTDNKLAS